MIDLETVEREISELEAREASYKVCERLAWLYIVRENIGGGRAAGARSYGGDASTEFLRLAKTVPYDRMLEIINDHLESVRLLYPKGYDTLMERLRSAG